MTTKLFAALLALVTLTAAVSAADAQGRIGSHRVGGYNSHGLGSHYVGGHRRHHFLRALLGSHPRRRPPHRHGLFH